MRRGFSLAPLTALVLSAVAARADSGIETVTVTAERRPEPLLTVPVTATVVDGANLHEKNINNALGLEALSPGLTVTGNLGSSDNAVFSIRGQNQPFGGADPGVQTYFAEVPFNAGGSGQYYDLDNVQVLEGPQGTFFGRNTTGGAVLFEPKRPDNSFGAYLDAEGGDYAFGQLQGAINVPLGDMFQLRVAGEVERRNGYTRDVSFNERTDNIDNEGIRVGLSFEPLPSVKNYLVADAHWDDTNGTGNELTAISTNPGQLAAFQNLAIAAFAAQGDPNAVTDGTNAFNGYYGALQFALANQQALGPRATTSTIEPYFKRETYTLVNQTEWDLTDHIRFRNIFGFQDAKTDPRYDYDGSFLPILEIANARAWQTNSTQLTDEVHALGESADNLFKWIVGYYYEGDYPGGYSEIQRQAFGGAANPPLGSTVFQVLNNGGTSNAVFAQASYDVSQFLPGVTLTAGGRYTWDRKVAAESDCAEPPAPGCPFPIPKGAPFALPTQVGHFSAPSWTLSADWAADDETHLYVTYRRGYKSGGFNSGGFEQGFKPEFLTDVEIGAKHAGTLLGMPASVSADAYYGWYDDIQKNDFTFVGFVPIVATFNAAKAHVAGFELQAEARPVDLLDLSFFYGYTDASYGVFFTPFSGNHKGDPFAYTPRNKLGATARVQIPVDPAWGTPYFSTTVYYQSRVWFSDFADVEPDSSQKAYALLNLRLDWDSICGSNLDAGLFLDNATNQLYKVGSNPLEHLILTTSSMYGPPRMFGVELRYHVGQ